MKKVLSVLALMTLATVLVAPVMVSAAETAPTPATQCILKHAMTGTTWTDKGITCPASGACLFSDTTNTCASCCLMDTIYTITDWIFLIIVVIAVIMILFGAFNIITAGGSPDKVTAGRNYILWAAVGVLVAAVAKIVPAVARSIVGM